MGIAEICESIKKYITDSREPVQQLPRLLLACSLIKRPGLSPIVSTANIVKDLNMVGINTGTMPDGSPNMTVAYTYAIVKEIFRALRLDAVVQVGISPGGFNIQAGPYMGTNLNAGNNTFNGTIV